MTKIEKVKRWFHDPFGQRELEEKHQNIIEAIVETVDVTRNVARRMEQGRFPIGSTVKRKSASQRGVGHARTV